MLPQTRPITDQMHRTSQVPTHPQRIISLVPSQTELLFDLGVGAQVVGVTKFCIHPTQARKSATIIGGTKQFDLAKIAALQPDLIIGNKEENYPEGINQLAANYPVWMSDITTLADALIMIQSIGDLTNTTTQAQTLTTEITTAFTALTQTINPTNSPKRVAYLIWRAPWLAAGSQTFIHEMLTSANLTNVFADRPRYPEITPTDLTSAHPDVVLLSSEPYPFLQKAHSRNSRPLPQCPNRISRRRTLLLVRLPPSPYPHLFNKPATAPTLNN